MASPQSATAPIIFIVFGVIFLFIAPPIGAIVGTIAIVFGAILLGVRVVAGTANAITSAVCPFCAEKIKAEATVCRYCGRDLNPSH